MTAEEKIRIAVRALDSKRAEDIRVLHVTDLTILGDYFIIANGNSTTHTKTLAEEVEFQLSQQGIEPHHREGMNGSNWYILDYTDVIVHVFCQDMREFYRLEQLWADAEEVDISGMIDKED
ncbi:MAG: ribosome silencing factor [Oscillospiraceae bacterium]|nr:ribosome silencing factor [Oscillospiraceae bacterium]